MVCWKCNEKVGGPLCVSCGALQPPPPKPDFFEVLGLDRRYSLERKVVDSAWRAKSRVTHPDRFAADGALQRRMALQWTASLNEARRVLRDPVARAWYLSTGEARPPEKDAPAVGPEFLEQVFELQMSSPEEKKARGLEMEAALTQEITALFEAWEAGDADLSAVPERLSRLKYVSNLVKD